MAKYTSQVREVLTITLDATKRLGMPPEGKSLVKKFNGGSMIGSVGREKGKADYYLIAEYYRPEAYGDDDASMGGFYLPHRPGSTRVQIELRGSSYEELAAQIAE